MKTTKFTIKLKKKKQKQNQKLQKSIVTTLGEKKININNIIIEHLKVEYLSYFISLNQ